MATTILTTKVKYTLGNMYRFVDKNGKIFFVKIVSIADATIAKLHGNLYNIAYSYNDNIKENEDVFYICEELNILNDPNFKIKTHILWDRILIHSETKRIYEEVTLRIKAVPDRVSSNIKVTRDDIIGSITDKLLEIPGITCVVEDITDESEDELIKFTRMVNMAYGLFNEIKTAANLIKPIADAVKDKDFNKLGEDITEYLDFIQSRLTMMEGNINE